jgi:1-acyl-sn-glycerol-3-phosphate acyltransferase
MENFPYRKPALLVFNHLGDADAIVGLAVIPVAFDGLAKAELYDLPVIGKLMEAYGVIWVHRGRPDRRALRAALNGLREGRVIAIAPEGRESLTGGLEAGTHGAAYLALSADVPIVPVTFTGTENNRIYPNLKRFRRTGITVTVGPAFRLENQANLRKSIDWGTERIMQVLASQLPEEYRGVFQGKT